MTQYIHYPTTAGGIPIYPNTAAFPPSLPDGSQVVDASTDSIYIFNAGSMSYVLVATPGASVAIDGLTGDVTASGPGVVPATISNGAVTNAKLANMANNTVKGNKSGGTAAPSDLALSDVVETGSSVLTISNGIKSIVQASNLSIQVIQATTSTSGYLSSTDWNTFNGKQAALTLGNLTDTGTDGITVTGGTGSVVGSGTSIAQHVADATHNGYLASTDFNTFNAKQPAGNYITALTGDVTATGPGSVAATIANLAVTNAKIANATIDLTTKVTGALPIANGGTGQTSASAAFGALSPLTTKGDVLGFSTVNARVPIGSNGQVLTADSTQTLGLKWATPAATGITSINGDTTTAQVIASSSPLKTVTSAGTTTLSGPFSSFVFQPGGTATAPGGNVYTSWPTLYADLIKASGVRSITFDDDFGAITIPAGTYALGGVSFYGTADTPVILLADGVVFSSFPDLVGPLLLASGSSSPVYTVPASTGGIYVNMGRFSEITAGSTAPLITVPVGNEFILTMLDGSTVSTGASSAVINVDGAMLVYMTAATEFDNNCLSGGAGGVVQPILGVASAVFSLVQSGYTGFIVTSLIEASSQIFYSPSNTSDWSPSPSQVAEALDQLAARGNTLESSYDYQTITTGNSHTIIDGVSSCKLNATGTILTYTLTMPANPTDGQLMLIGADQAITTFTLSPNSGQTFVGTIPTTLALGGTARYQWIATNSKWWPV